MAFGHDTGPRHATKDRVCDRRVAGRRHLSLLADRARQHHRQHAARSSRGKAPRPYAKTARKSFEQYAKYLLDFLRTPESGATELAALIEFDEWDGIDAIFREGKGLIAAPMHFGNWDIGAAFFSRHGYAVNAIVDTFGHSKLNDMVVGARLAGGTRVIPIERAGIASLRALRKNEVLAILLDRPQPDNGVAVTFFGAEVVLPAGVARLALRTGARVVPVAILPR